jgi:hypothetical protein
MTAEPILQQPCEQRVGVGPDSALFYGQTEKGVDTFRTENMRLLRTILPLIWGAVIDRIKVVEDLRLASHRIALSPLEEL